MTFFVNEPSLDAGAEALRERQVAHDFQRQLRHELVGNCIEFDDEGQAVVLVDGDFQAGSTEVVLEGRTFPSSAF